MGFYSRRSLGALTPLFLDVVLHPKLRQLHVSGLLSSFSYACRPPPGKATRSANRDAALQLLEPALGSVLAGVAAGVVIYTELARGSASPTGQRISSVLMDVTLWLGK